MIDFLCGVALTLLLETVALIVAAEDAIGFMNLHFLGHGETKSVLDSINEVPAVDAVEVVRCEKCVHCVNDEEEPGMCKCVESAEYDSESGLWLGFVEYHTPDFYCAYGERKDND